MTSGSKPPWHRAVADANEEDAPASVEDAVRDELANLWSDLDTAMHMAYRGRWSVGCDNITGRIIRLSRMAGTISWQQVPIPMLLDGTWHRLLAHAGIEHDEPGEDDLRKMRAWRDGERAAVRGIKGDKPGSAPLPPVLALSINIPGLGAIPVRLAGADKPLADGTRLAQMADALRSAVKAGAISEDDAAGHLMNTCEVDRQTASDLIAGRQAAS